jgi:hypothetical protein
LLEQDGIWSLVWGCLLLLHGQCLNDDGTLEMEIHGAFSQFADSVLTLRNAKRPRAPSGTRGALMRGFVKSH